MTSAILMLANRKLRQDLLSVLIDHPSFQYLCLFFSFFFQADIYHCGCIEGYQCKPANVGNYWGKCEEESGSGLGENIVS